MKRRHVIFATLLSALVVAVAASATAGGTDRPTFEDLLRSPTPFAIGHKGAGDNLTDPSRPYEESTQAVRAGLRGGMRVVEVDAVLAADGVAIAKHDDFLADYTCVNTLKVGELRDLLPAASTIEQVLDAAKPFPHGEDFGGLVVIELKPPSPLCDPADETERALAAAVVRAVEKTGMTDRVAFESFSPALLALAAELAPDVPRVLTLSPLQFLTAEQIEAYFGLHVTVIDKEPDFGLQWAEIGPLYRLPGYGSPLQFLLIALGLGSRALSVDMLFFGQAELSRPGSGAAFVAAAHSLDLSVWGYTVNVEPEWEFLASLGVDGIYTNDVALGARLQADL